MARVDLRENEFMERFVSEDHIDSNDVQFWYQLLSCSFNFMRVQDPRVVDKTLAPYLNILALSNGKSLNIGSLIRVFLDRVSKIKSGQSTNSYYVFQSFNALYLIRSICKSYIENNSEEQLIKSFLARIDPTPPPQVSQKPMPPVNLQQQLFSPPAQKPQSQPLTPSENQPTSQVKEAVVSSQGAQEGMKDGVLSPGPDNAIDIKDSPEMSKESNPKVELTPGPVMLDQFISTLIAIIVDIPLTDSTYLLQVESINALLVLLSVQMYSKNLTDQPTIYKCLMSKKCSIHALLLTKTLLNNFSRQQPVPQETGSIIIGLASGLWKVLTLGYGVSQEDEDAENIPLLARQSLLLLNILTNHYSAEKNPYREAIISCQDSKYSLSDPQTALQDANNDALATASTSRSVLTSNSIKIDFRELYETICKYSHNDQVALLLYLLLHSNKIFRPYILTTASSELDKLILPLLKILYLKFEKGSHHVYMVLIIFIILTEELVFNESIYKINVRGVTWYKDRVFSEISVGSLTVLIIIRSFQYNTFRIKDSFLHNNLFAILANLSNHFHNLHPYACQRLVELLERLSKRYLMLTKPNSNELNPGQSDSRGPTLEVLDNPLAKALATDTHKQDLQDASAIEIDSTAANNSNTNSSQNGATAININIPEQHSSVDSEPRPMLDLQRNGRASNDNSSGQQSPNSSSTNEHLNISMDDTRLDIGLLEDIIRMVLLIINNSLSMQLKNNPDLIYTLLYKRSVFSSLLSSHQSFYNIVIDIERVLTFFYNKIEAFERSLSVDEIKDLIKETSKEWNYNQNRETSAHLLFRYQEREAPEEFFIPYIWTRIYYSSGIVWNHKGITLFNPEDL